MAESTPVPGSTPRGFLGLIERIGNALPDPALLFFYGCILIMVVSHLGVVAGWSVTPIRMQEVTTQIVDASGVPVIDAETGLPKTEPVIDTRTGRPKTELIESGDPITARSLLSADGIYWCLANMVNNFVRFPPLGIVLVAMFGVGVAEKTGLFDTLIKGMALLVPQKLLTPAMIFIGIMANIASDAGYIVLPPLAAALYLASGRSPLAGIAAAFAGVSAGFSANLLIGGTDALIAGITTSNAHILDPNYDVDATANWYFLAASTVLLVAVGWAVAALIVEPRLKNRPADEGGPSPNAKIDLAAMRLTSTELKGLLWAGVALALFMAALGALILVPGAPLHGAFLDTATGRSSTRWVNAVVPIVLFAFLVPGAAYGAATGQIRSQKDVISCMIHAMRSMAPVITMAFFASQFIAFFTQSNLGQMLAIIGGTRLAEANLPASVVILGFILLVMFLNLLISSMSAKYVLVAPIFVPMFMMLGISPELTQAGYRVADSATNIITPMNAYMIIILAVMQKFAPRAGIGTLVSTMLPYSIAFALTWGIFIVIWMQTGLPLGPGAPLHYSPTAVGP
ncbi:MAG: AbgT family transporter [Phycisphaeraceae bacterium]|nr:AbgT family transporter [Phycisphaeraceae bacterium]